jgi:hypothetical protein
MCNTRTQSGRGGTRPYIRALPTKPQQEQSSIGGKGGIKAAIPHALFIINNFDSVPARTSVEGNRLKQIGMESEPLSNGCSVRPAELDLPRNANGPVTAARGAGDRKEPKSQAPQHPSPAKPARARN